MGFDKMKCFVVLALALATANAGTLQDKYANAKPGYMRIPGWQKIQSGMKKLNQKEPTGTYVPRPEHTPKKACGIPNANPEKIVGGVEATPHEFPWQVGLFFNGYNAGNDGEYYCDAFAGNGLYCPEYDTWEGNKHTMAVTLHTCDGGGGWWNSCDGGGCQSNAFYENGSLMCPEDRCTINTNRPFTVSHYQTSGSVNVWFEQDGRTASFDACKDGGYIGRFAPAFNDMVFVASLWGGGGIDMGWLDGMTGCGGDCNLGASSVAFSNFNIW